MKRVRESDLYEPVKLWLGALGFEVKAEVGAADVVALSDGEVTIVELKTGFSLTLLQQAVARQALTDSVYVAVPRWSGKAGWRAFRGNIGLCRRLGVGVISVRLADGFVELHADPAPFRPRKSGVRKERLLSEFSRRVGDPNTGGTRGQVVTAYKQDCARIAAHLARNGAMRGAEVARETGVAKATRMMADNHLGWFERVERGVYGLSTAGRAAVAENPSGAPE